MKSVIIKENAADERSSKYSCVYNFHIFHIINCHLIIYQMSSFQVEVMHSCHLFKKNVVNIEYILGHNFLF